jgi:hypothetical protein
MSHSLSGIKEGRIFKWALNRSKGQVLKKKKKKKKLSLLLGIDSVYSGGV